MNAHKPLTLAGSIFTLIIVAMMSPNFALTHCDALDGPVVTLARTALDTGNVNLVLPWAPSDDEPEVRQAFDHTQAVHKLGSEAKHLADTFFFETLVHVHRASEGAPYTRLKPAGLGLGPAIPAADKALDAGSMEAVELLLIDAIRKGLREQFHATINRMKFDPNDVAARHLYVETYVPYIHDVQGLWEAASTSAKGHYTEPAAHAQ